MTNKNYTTDDMLEQLNEAFIELDRKSSRPVANRSYKSEEEIKRLRPVANAYVENLEEERVKRLSLQERTLLHTIRGY
ncbi:MAG: hypothetical protein AABW84_02555 [Nanoarchaeota archaeon]